MPTTLMASSSSSSSSSSSPHLHNYSTKSNESDIHEHILFGGQHTCKNHIKMKPGKSQVEKAIFLGRIPPILPYRPLGAPHPHVPTAPNPRPHQPQRYGPLYSAGIWRPNWVKHLHSTSEGAMFFLVKNL